MIIFSIYYMITKNMLLLGLILFSFSMVGCSNGVSKESLVEPIVILNNNIDNFTNKTIDKGDLRIKGVLLDAHNNDTVSDALLVTLTKTIPEVVRTDDNGKFSFKVVNNSIGVFEGQSVRSGWVFFISDTAGDWLEANREDNDFNNPLVFSILKQKNDTPIYDFDFENLTLYIEFSKCMMAGQTFMDTDNRTCCEGLNEVTTINKGVCDENQILNRVCVKLNDGICAPSEMYCNSPQDCKN